MDKIESHDKLQSRVWITNDGVKIAIKYMDEQHVRNALGMILQRIEEKKLIWYRNGQIIQ